MIRLTSDGRARVSVRHRMLPSAEGLNDSHHMNRNDRRIESNRMAHGMWFRRANRAAQDGGSHGGLIMRGLPSGIISLAVIIALLLACAGPAGASTYRVIYRFAGGSDGASPSSRL